MFRRKKIKQMIGCILVLAMVVTNGNVMIKNLSKTDSTSQVLADDNTILPFELVSTSYGIISTDISEKELRITDENTSTLIVMDHKLIFLRQELSNGTSNIYIIGHTGLITTLNVDSDDKEWINSALDGWGTGNVSGINRLYTDLEYREYMVEETGVDPGQCSIHDIYYVHNKKTQNYILIDATDGDYYICDERPHIIGNTGIYQKNIIIKKDGKNELYNLEKGELLYNCQFDEIYIENNKVAVAEIGDKYGIIMLDGSGYSQAKYDGIYLGRNIYVGFSGDDTNGRLEQIDVLGRNGNVIKSFDENCIKEGEFEYIECMILGEKVYVNYHYGIDTIAIREYDSKEFTKNVSVCKGYIVSNSGCKEANELFGGEYCSFSMVYNGGRGDISNETDAIHFVKYSLEMTDGYLGLNDASDNITGYYTMFKYWKLKRDFDAIIDNHNNLSFIIPEEDIEINGGNTVLTYVFADNGSYVKYDKINNMYKYCDKYGKELFDLGQRDGSPLINIGENYIYYNQSIIDIRTGKIVLDNIGYHSNVYNRYIGNYNDKFLESGYIFVYSEEEEKVGIIDTSDNHWTGYQWNCNIDYCKVYKLNNDKYMFELGKEYFDQNYNKVFENNGETYVKGGKIICFDKEIVEDYLTVCFMSIYNNNFQLEKKIYCNKEAYSDMNCIDILCDYIPIVSYNDSWEWIGIGLCDISGKTVKSVDIDPNYRYCYANQYMINGLAYMETKQDGCCIIDKNCKTVVKLDVQNLRLSNSSDEPIIDSGYYISGNFNGGYIYDMTKVMKKPNVNLLSDDNIAVSYDANKETNGLILRTRKLSENDDKYNNIDFNGKIVNETVSSSEVKFVAYEIELLDENDNIVQPKSMVKVKIPCPEEYYGTKCNVYRAEQDGTFTNMKAIYEDGYLIFETNHFSIYLITETELITNPDIIPGDANGDGKMDIKDSAIIKRYLAGWDVEINMTAADMDGDGKVTIKDSALIKRQLAGWE